LSRRLGVLGIHPNLPTAVYGKDPTDQRWKDDPGRLGDDIIRIGRLRIAMR
jgi:hypothetical protein